MSDALATVQSVTKRLEEEPTPEMLVMIGEYLESASDQARYYGREWTVMDCPGPVSRLVSDAVARFMRNPDGFAQNRAAEETLGWQESPFTGRVFFYQDEIERLQRFGNPRLPKFGSIQMVAYQTRPYVDPLIRWPVDYPGGKPFPLFQG